MSRLSSSGPDILFTVENTSVHSCICSSECACVCVHCFPPDSTEDTTLTASCTAASSLSFSAFNKLLLSCVAQLWILIGCGETRVGRDTSLWLSLCLFDRPRRAAALLSLLLPPCPVFAPTLDSMDGPSGCIGAARTTLVWPWTSSKMHFCRTAGSCTITTSAATQSLRDGGKTIIIAEA